MKKITFILITVLLLSVFASCATPEPNTSVDDDNSSSFEVEKLASSSTSSVTEIEEISEYVEQVDPPFGIYFESFDMLQKALSLKGAEDDEIKAYFKSFGHFEDYLVYDNATLQWLIDVFSTVPLLVPNENGKINRIYVEYVPEWSRIIIKYYIDGEYQFQLRTFLPSDDTVVTDKAEYTDERLTYGDLQLKRVKNTDNYKGVYKNRTVVLFGMHMENFDAQNFTLKTLAEVAE